MEKKKKKKKASQTNASMYLRTRITRQETQPFLATRAATYRIAKSTDKHRALLDALAGFYMHRGTLLSVGNTTEVIGGRA